MNEPSAAPNRWEQLTVRLIMLGIDVAQDPEGLSSGSIPDQRDDDRYRQLLPAVQTLLDHMKSYADEMKQDPEKWKRKVEELEQAASTPWADLESQLTAVAWEWFCEHFDGLPIDSARVEDELAALESNESDQSVPDFLQTNRMGLRRELVDWILSEGVRPQLTSVPARLLLLGLWRVLRDLEFGAGYLAMRPVADSYTTIFDVLDPDILRASRIYMVLHNVGDQIQKQVDREFLLARHALRGPSQLSPYLPLLQRCFVSQFDRECVIICRSLLEDAFRCTYDRYSIPSYDALHQKIDGALERTWLTPALARDAHDVRLRANKVLHEEALLEIDALDTVGKTLGVVNHLLGHTPEDG